MNLYYPIEIDKIPEEGGGGYIACIPRLGRKALRADGSSITEAIENLDRVKEEWFTTFLKRGTLIPEPQTEQDEEFSGKFIVRIPKDLHRSLSLRADANKISLNQYVQYLLTSSMVSEGFESVMEKCHLKFNQLVEEMKNIEYKFEGHALATSSLQSVKQKYASTILEFRKAV